MNRRALGLLAGATCVTLLAIPGSVPAESAVRSSNCPYENSTPLAAGEDRARTAMYCLINLERRKARRARLTVNSRLEAEGMSFAAQMVAEQFFSHVDPQGNGLTQRTVKSGYLDGYEVWALGENIGWGSGALGTPKAMMAAFLASSPHRRSILSRRYRNMGVGVSTGIPVGGRFGATYVQQFGWRSR
jgi:uncharacterized protein YkwD